MKIGILKTDTVRAELVDQYGEYPAMFEQVLTDNQTKPIEVITYDVVNGQYPDAIDEVDGYVITGSKRSVYDDETWIAQLGEFVKQLHQQQKKVVGICFGHQLIAHFMGGRTEKSDRGWGIGVKSAAFVSDEPLPFNKPDNMDSFKIFYSHQDQVIVPVPGSKILAGNAFCPIAMTSLDSHILTIQGHPEFAQDFGRDLLALRKQQFDDQTYSDFTHSLGHGDDRALVASWIVDFIAG